MADQPNRLERNPNNKIVAGVASGLADFIGIDPTVVRVIWALSVFLGGIGVVAYVVMWIVIPEAGSDRTVAHDLRDKTVGSTGTDASSDDAPASAPETGTAETGTAETDSAEEVQDRPTSDDGSDQPPPAVQAD